MTRRAYVPPLIVALILTAALLIVALVPIPSSRALSRGEADGVLRASRGAIWRGGDCVRVSWDVSGIDGVYFDGAGTVGADEREICPDVDSMPALTVAYADGVSVDYRVPVTVLSASAGFWWTVIVMVGAWVAALVMRFAPSGEGGRMLGRVVQTVVTVSVSVVVTLLLLEGALRGYFGLFGSERDRLVYLGSADDIAAANERTVGLPFLNYGGVPDVDGVNTRGFRNPDREHPKPDDTYRILALGGSTTYGQDVTWEEAYPMQLERSLREDYGYANVEVINGGYPNYDTMNSIVNLQTRGLEQEPDLVLLYQGYNDMVRRWQQPNCFVGESPLYGLGGDPGIWTVDVPPLNPSVTVRFVQLQLGLIADPSALTARFALSDELCPPLAYVPNQVDRLAANPPTFYARNLRTLIGIAEAHDVDVMFTTQPYQTQLVDENRDNPQDTVGLWRSIEVGMAEHTAILRETAAETDIYFYDFAADFTIEPDEWLDVIHMGPEGLRKQGEAFAAFIDAEGLIAE